MLLAEQINEDQLQTVLANFVQRETRLGEADLGNASPCISVRAGSW